jgi:effector-binding domain-containing protein
LPRYHDEEFTPTDIDVEVAIPVAADVDRSMTTPGGRTLEPMGVPGGEMAVTLHEGSYETLDSRYSAIGIWIAESGYHVAGPPQGACLREPTAEAPPLTEICFPVTQ